MPVDYLLSMNRLAVTLLDLMPQPRNPSKLHTVVHAVAQHEATQDFHPKGL